MNCQYKILKSTRSFSSLFRIFRFQSFFILSLQSSSLFIMCNQVGQVLVLRRELPLAADLLLPEFVGLLRHPVPLSLLVQRCKRPDRESEDNDQDAADGNFFMVPVFLVVVAIDGVPHGASTIVEVGVLPRNQEPLSKLFFVVAEVCIKLFLFSHLWFSGKT